MAWWSERRILGVLWAAVLVFIATLSVCYAAWISEGCSPLLPFISDLGLHGIMRIIFNSGLTCGAVLFAVASVHVWLARRSLLAAGKAHTCYRWLNNVSTVGAFCISFGIGAIGFFPWDQHFAPHILCADAIFFGGSSWSIMNVLLLRRIGQHSIVRNLQCRTKLVGAQLVLVCVSFFSLVLMKMSIGDDLNDLGPLLRNAHDHFYDYCEAKSMDNIGIGALFEWLLILSLIGGVPFVHLDVKAQFLVPEQEMK